MTAIIFDKKRNTQSGLLYTQMNLALVKVVDKPWSSVLWSVKVLFKISQIKSLISLTTYNVPTFFEIWVVKYA